MNNLDYEVNGFSLTRIRNINEIRVIKVMRELLPPGSHFDTCQLCTEDIYALSVKQLPPQYVQVGSIVLKKAVSDEDIRAIVRKSIDQVAHRPNHG